MEPAKAQETPTATAIPTVRVTSTVIRTLTPIPNKMATPHAKRIAPAAKASAVLTARSVLPVVAAAMSSKSVGQGVVLPTRNVSWVSAYRCALLTCAAEKISQNVVQKEKFVLALV